MKVTRAVSFRSAQRLAVWMEVQIPEASSWNLGRVLLVNEAEKVLRSLRVWPQGPLSSGRNTIILELEAGQRELREQYSLELHESGSGRIFTVWGIRFP